MAAIDIMILSTSVQQSFHHCCSQDSFGGNTRTVMIANITAAQADMDETINTLKYEPLVPQEHQMHLQR